MSQDLELYISKDNHEEGFTLIARSEACPRGSMIMRQLMHAYVGLLHVLHSTCPALMLCIAYLGAPSWLVSCCPVSTTALEVCCLS